MMTRPTGARARLLSVTAALPPRERTSAEVEALIAEASDEYRPRSGTIAAISGVATRRVAHEAEQCSDLAAAAARSALCEAKVDPSEVDLLVFAAASQDLLEPATAHIVQEKIGTRCPVFDVKNACNSFLNGMQIAEALILGGSALTALVVTGEVCSRAVSWSVRDSEHFRRVFPGFTMGDAGAAAVLQRSDDGRGIFYRRFVAASEHWELATIRAGGSMHPRGEEFTYLDADGAGLRDAFLGLGARVVQEMLEEANVRFDDFARIFVHQPTLAYRDDLLAAVGIPADRVEHTIETLGNMAAASLPVALVQARARGAVRDGDRILLLGLASGISLGAMMIDV